MTNLLEELRWRGMVHDVMPGLEEQLAKELTAGYVGFDPTAASLHIGNLATLMLLVHLQRAGHKPVALVGGATGMVGDPSGKSQERNLLDEETLRHNQTCIRHQLEQFLDFDAGAQSAEIVNNYDWFRDFNFLRFLREVGKHLTVNYMMAKDSVQKRLETGLSFTEFSYQLLQGYDFQYLYQNKGVKLQMGGSDQWGNITSGTELIRRMGGEAAKAYALTCPLVTKSDGTKFGKSEDGNIWLDPKMTSPYKFYQFWINVADEDAGKMLRVFTLLGQEQIEQLEADHVQSPGSRIMQKALAEELTERVHGKAALSHAQSASEVLFGKSVSEALQQLDEQTLLEVFEGVPKAQIAQAALQETTDLPSLLSTATNKVIFNSKGEARRMLGGGGVSINKAKVSPDTDPQSFELLCGKYLVVQKGKKNYFLVELIK